MTLLAPLWVVNATSLAVDAAIVPLEAATQPLRPASFRQQSQQQRIRSQPAAEALRCGCRAEWRVLWQHCRCSVERYALPCIGACCCCCQCSSHLIKCRAGASRQVIATDDGDPTQRGDIRGRRFVAPASMELLSYPLPTYQGLQGASQQQQLGPGAGAAAEQQQPLRQRQRYGVRLRVASSGWTPALALDAEAQQSGGNGGAGQQGQQPAEVRLDCPLPPPIIIVCSAASTGWCCCLITPPALLMPASACLPACLQAEGLRASRPVLIRALVRDSGLVHEVSVRLEVTSYGTSQVSCCCCCCCCGGGSSAIAVMLCHCRWTPAPKLGKESCGSLCLAFNLARVPAGPAPGAACHHQQPHAGAASDPADAPGLGCAL